MPLNTDNPQIISQIEADVWEVLGWHTAPPTAIHVQYRAGVSQDGVVTWVYEGKHDLSPAVVYALATKTPDGAKSYYENLKADLYQAMQDDGVFPQGTLS